MAKNRGTLGTSYECEALENELCGALYVARALLVGAESIALRLERDGEPDPDMPFYIQHCIAAARRQMESITHRIPEALHRISRGDPIGKTALIGYQVDLVAE